MSQASASPARDRTANPYAPLNGFFDRIFVVTLPRAATRQARLVRDLEGLRYELFLGVDKRDLDLAELVARGIYDPARARRLHRYGREMQLGQIACTLSHAALWREVVAGGGRRPVLVLEDDAVPCPDGLAAVGEALAQLPPSWELLYLGYDRHERVTARRRLDRLVYVALGALGLHYLSAREAANLLPRPFSPRLRRAGLHDQTHAYAITPVAAERLLRFQEPVALDVDTGISRSILRGEIEAYVADPKAFRQAGDDSLVRSE